MKAVDHASKLLETCTRRLYALRMSTTPSRSVQNIHERCLEGDTPRQGNVLHLILVWLLFRGRPRKTRRVCTPLQKLHYSDDDIPAVQEMFVNADVALFSRVVGNDKHVLQHYLPDCCKIEYNFSYYCYYLFYFIFKPTSTKPQARKLKLNNGCYYYRKKRFW